MADSCVLLEAFKQFMDPDAMKAKPETDLVAMSQKSSSNAKNMLSRLCKKRERRERREKRSVQNTEAKKLAATPSPKPAPTPKPAEVTPQQQQLPLTTSMIFYAKEAKLSDGKLRIYLQNLHVITKGLDFFTIDLNNSVQALKLTLDTSGSVSVILVANNVHELRDVLDVKYFVSPASEQTIAEFALGDMQVSDGGNLEGSLTDVKLFFGNLPATR